MGAPGTKNGEKKQSEKWRIYHDPPQHVENVLLYGEVYEEINRPSLGIND